MKVNKKIIGMCNTKVYSSKDFSLLRSNYSVLLQSFPEEHCQTLNILQHKLTDDVISFILNCTNSYAANKTILDYFIDSMKCRGDLLDLCDVLDEFIDSPNILCIAQELRKGNLASVSSW